MGILHQALQMVEVVLPPGEDESVFWYIVQKGHSLGLSPIYQQQLSPPLISLDNFL